MGDATLICVLALAVVLGIRIGLRCTLTARTLFSADRRAETACDAAELAETADEKRWTL